MNRIKTIVLLGLVVNCMQAMEKEESVWSKEIVIQSGQHQGFVRLPYNQALLSGTIRDFINDAKKYQSDTDITFRLPDTITLDQLNKVIPFLSLINEYKSDDETSVIDRLRRFYNEQQWDSHDKKIFNQLANYLDIEVLKRAISYVKISACNGYSRYFPAELLKKGRVLNFAVDGVNDQDELPTEGISIPNIGFDDFGSLICYLEGKFNAEDVVDIFTLERYLSIAHYLGQSDDVEKYADRFVELLLQEDTLRKYVVENPEQFYEQLSGINVNNDLQDIILKKIKEVDLKFSCGRGYGKSSKSNRDVKVSDLNKKLSVLSKFADLRVNLDGDFLWVIERLFRESSIELIRRNDGVKMYKKVVENGVEIKVDKHGSFAWVVNQSLGILELLQLSSGVISETCIRKNKNISCFDFSPNLRNVIILYIDEIVELIKIDDNNGIKVDNVAEWIFGDKGNLLLIITTNQQVILVDFKSLTKRIIAKNISVIKFGANCDEKFLYVQHENDKAFLFDLENNKSIELDDVSGGFKFLDNDFLQTRGRREKTNLLKLSPVACAKDLQEALTILANLVKEH